jgi:hypothetical protein
VSLGSDANERLGLLTANLAGATSKTEVVRRALVLLEVLSEETQDGARAIEIDKDGERVKIPLMMLRSI